MQVTVLWPPRTHAPLPAPLASQPSQPQASAAPAADSFSAETRKILDSLGPAAQARPAASAGDVRQGPAAAAADALRVEELKHSQVVVGIEWSPVSLAAGTELHVCVLVTLHCFADGM